MTDKQDPIAHAARLLREAAEELRQAHAYNRSEGWENETDAKAAYDEHMAAAQALEDWEAAVGAGGVQALSAAPAVAAPAAPTPEHIAAMERAWLWMDNQADQQSKGGHATFDLMMLREERDALRAAIDAAPKAAPAEVLGWIYEDELPESYPYSAMFLHSKVDTVRMFPVFGPTAAPQQEAPLMPKGESAASKLRAMAANYPAGHLWDKLDAQACAQGAMEIEALRVAPQQEAQEPALFVSAKQLAALTDPDDPDGEHGRYLPVRKTTKGLFTQALYTAPQPAPAPATPDGDELRKIARAARTSASDDASPTEYVLAGWRAALAAHGGK